MLHHVSNSGAVPPGGTGAAGVGASSASASAANSMLNNLMTDKTKLETIVKEKPSIKLGYSIIKCSSYSSTYYPDNILEDKPKDHTSRWSSDSNLPPQYVILKLSRPAIVKHITFGKFEKTHVCNLRKFKIYGGIGESNLTELLESGLKNDSTPETFPLKHQINGHILPCRYIKIDPLQSWGPSFNFSIWYVELKGIDDYEIVQPCIAQFSSFQEKEAIRVCLKHLRDHNYMDAFESLQKKTKVQLEDPIITEFHEILVKKGNFDEAEKFLERCSESHLFHNFITQQEYKAIWTQLATEKVFNFAEVPPLCDGTTKPWKPSMRGGHQMCIDMDAETIYLFGGWDGHQDLADFWAYSIEDEKWTLLSENTALEGGPSPRSCHKIVFDSEHRQIFTLGRYIEATVSTSSTAQQQSRNADFYVYDLESNKWTLITDDTAGMGGPELIYDHQICIDTEKKMIYVFGGRVLNPINPPAINLPGGPLSFPPILSSSSPNQNVSGDTPSLMSGSTRFSGLYSYHIATNTWKLLRTDISSSINSVEKVRSRVAHSMLFHPEQRKLYIFAGMRHKDCLHDFFSYDVDKDEIDMISDGSKEVTATHTPSAGFTQRATIDPALNEIYVFSGVNKEKDKKDEQVQNSFWVFDILRKKWSCVYRNEQQLQSTTEPNPDLLEPCPRFAHQLVYDSTTNLHYLFGGNPGRSKEPKARLDDFWSLRLIRPAKDDVLKQCKIMLRKQKFEELASQNTFDALMYLQSSLSELIDHSDPKQERDFQKLTLHLFSNPEHDGEDLRLLEGETGPSHIEWIQEQKIRARSRIFDKVVRFFPDEMTQPKVDLVQLLLF